MCVCVGGGGGGGVKLRNIWIGSSYFAEKHLDVGNFPNWVVQLQAHHNTWLANSQGVSLPHTATWRRGALGVHYVCVHACSAAQPVYV